MCRCQTVAGRLTGNTKLFAAKVITHFYYVRWDYRPKEEEIEWIRKRSIEVNNGGLIVPNNFVKSVEVFQPGQSAPASM